MKVWPWFELINISWKTEIRMKIVYESNKGEAQKKGLYAAKQ